MKVQQQTKSDLVFWQTAIAYYSPDNYTYIVKGLIECAIMAIGSPEFSNEHFEECSAVVATLTLAKHLVPDEYAMNRAFPEAAE